MDIFGWIGAFISICFFCSPIINFYKLIKKKKQYTEINIIIILGNYVSSIVWLIYGYKISCTQIITCYSIGAFISLVWIWIYLIHMGKKKMTITLIYALSLSVLTFALYIVLAIIIDDKDTLGEVCFIVCTLSYISPTQLLIRVLNKKDYRIIPIYSAIISSLGFGSWTIFGLFKFSATIIIPNLVGLIFSAVQIILYRVYKNKKPLDEEIGNISNSVIGAVKNVVERTVEIANTLNQNAQNNVNNLNNNESHTATDASLEVKNNIENNNTNNNQNNNNIINFDTNNVDNKNVTDINNINFNTNLEINPENNNNFNAIQNNVNINNNV
jgi:solute carrier family 50 protein (sugar transporter)